MSRNAQIQFFFCLVLLTWRLGAGAADYLPAHAADASARVVVVQGQNLLDAYLADDSNVDAAFNRGLLALTLQTNVASAWSTLVKTNDIVGIKVFSAPGPFSGSRPAVVAAIARGLLAAGIPASNIIIWDKHSDNLRVAGFFHLGQQLGLNIMGTVDSGYDENTYYLPDAPVIGALVWGDLEFSKTGDQVGKKSFLSKLVSQRLTKIISVAPLLNENDAGICGHFFSLALGSVDNTRRFQSDPERLAVALPEIYALPSLGDKVVLHVTDALLGQYQGGPASFLQFSVPLEQIWLSHDPVALDTLALKELVRERKNFNAPQVPVNYQIYTNAVLLQLGTNDPAKIKIERIN